MQLGGWGQGLGWGWGWVGVRVGGNFILAKGQGWVGGDRFSVVWARVVWWVGWALIICAILGRWGRVSLDGLGFVCSVDCCRLAVATLPAFMCVLLVWSSE